MPMHCWQKHRGWRRCGKRPIYNLCHYLNHYNLFGNSYLDGYEAGLRAIERIAAR
jgi:fructosamine-3-kinase